MGFKVLRPTPATMKAIAKLQSEVDAAEQSLGDGLPDCWLPVVKTLIRGSKAFLKLEAAQRGTHRRTYR